MVDAITHHHPPSAGRHTRFISPVTAVHVAGPYVDCGGDITKAVFDLDHLHTAGVGPEVESRFALARLAHDEAA